ncbi:hypothetical protein AY586_16680 [Marichromatium gracile]|uniref:Uncharacterized protein n=1 Tax=Marichromatium gracile TaxID=1048 RepID=A0ABR5VD41_MARGR|nr:hypothetical protein AY586_16680 [Marichromatium gracile]
MNDTGLLDAELNSTTLGVFNSLGDVWRYSTDLRVRHHAARAENLTETTDQWHHVRCCDHCVEIDRTALNFCNQIFSTNNVRTSNLSFFSLGIARKYGNANSLASTVRQNTRTTNHLVRMTRIYAEVDGKFNAFVELGLGPILEHGQSFTKTIGLVAINAFTGRFNALTYFRHRSYSVTSMPMERAEPSIMIIADSISLAFRSFILASAISRT